MTDPRLAIDHLGIAVADLDAATHTYAATLGLVALGGERLPERGLEVRFFAAGDSRIELLGATRPDSEISGFLARRGEGLHHVCLRVQDLEARVAALAKAGARLIPGAGGQVITRGAHDRRVAFVHPKSTHGLLLELVEDAPAASKGERP